MEIDPVVRLSDFEHLQAVRARKCVLESVAHGCATSTMTWRDGPRAMYIISVAAKAGNDEVEVTAEYREPYADQGYDAPGAAALVRQLMRTALPEPPPPAPEPTPDPVPPPPYPGR